MTTKLSTDSSQYGKVEGLAKVAGPQCFLVEGHELVSADVQVGEVASTEKQGGKVGSANGRTTNDPFQPPYTRDDIMIVALMVGGELVTMNGVYNSSLAYEGVENGHMWAYRQTTAENTEMARVVSPTGTCTRRTHNCGPRTPKCGTLLGNRFFATFGNCEESVDSLK